MKHAPLAAPPEIIRLAILAVGGQGGGVLTAWITDLARTQGYWAQATSVAGVAQRTGATIYYIEMAPRDPARPDRAPVFALSPAKGDVDILIAAELAEAGRAILRGFVTPERTTLIASSHRMLAVSEKIAPGDGRADAPTLIDHARSQSRRLIAFDMEAVARAHDAHVSASLFGALAASGALPFTRAAFEATIRAAGRGVDPSLHAFADAFDAALAPPATSPPTAAAPSAPPAPSGPEALLTEWRTLAARAAAYPPPVAEMATHGLARVVDYLDLAYGAEYLDRVERARAVDAAPFAFTEAAAKHLANAMAYDDLPRVADLKTRASRAARIRAEAGAAPAEPVQTTDYLHPRMAEVMTTLPASLGAWVAARPGLMSTLDRVVNRGRRIRSDRIPGFLMLWLVASLRPYRRRLLRHRSETAHLAHWFDLALATHATDPALATEILNARRLIKGYSDTHARGLSKYDRVLAALPRIAGRPDAADWLRRLIAAAMKDPDGAALDGALATIRTFTDQNPGPGKTPNAMTTMRRRKDDA